MMHQNIVFIHSGVSYSKKRLCNWSQSAAIESLFAILTSFQRHENDATGDVGSDNIVDFGLFVTNHVLLPMLQNWLRQCSHSVHVRR